ncbi:cellulose-binding domain-containing protein, partial [Streptomyces sp. SCA3-4]|uniref:cellulose-binding domain-containing protein n=1 Tax=Streptomyces sichuanensis TaxID=2871810 RepID=UPI001CE2AAB0
MSTGTSGRRRRLIRPRSRAATAALAALLLPLATLVGLATPAHAAPSATATFVKTSEWGTGFQGQWTVKNTGTSPLAGWTVEWDFPSGTAIGSYWDALVTSSGTHHTAKNREYNGTVAPGASVTFGFVATGDGAPAGCRLDGGPCDGSPADTPPSAPGTPVSTGVTADSVSLKWAAATDDKGVKDYDVYRGPTKVATVAKLAHTD